MRELGAEAEELAAGIRATRREGTLGEEIARIQHRGTHLEADVYLPEGGGPHPAVVMAHGFGALRSAGLPDFARRFREAGILAVVFDYRHFGGSGGTPRHLLSIRRQLQDWHEALRYTRSREDVDESRVALWGTSFSGGHVVRVAARDGSVAAVVAQVPFTAGVDTVPRFSPRSIAKAGLAGLADLARSALGGRPVYMPVAGRWGEGAAMPQDEAVEAFERMHAGTEWENRVCARIGLATLLSWPRRAAARVEAPLLVQPGEKDRLTPPGPAGRMARSAPRGELRSYPIGHFDIYFEPWFETAVEDQVAFLTRHLRPAPVPRGQGQDSFPGDG